MLTISQVQSIKDIESVKNLIREFTRWAISLEKGSEDAPTFQNLDKELATLPGKYSPPTGTLLLAKKNRRAIGCIALIGLDQTTCELKRMYVIPEFRGFGIGRQLVQKLIEVAKELGFERMILDSHYTMVEAHSLYRSMGFVDVEPWPGFPEELRPLVVFMEKDLNKMA